MSNEGESSGIQIWIAVILIAVLLFALLIGSRIILTEDAKWIIVTIIGSIGLLGHFPKVIRYLEPKPNLKVELVVHPTGSNYLYIVIKNVGSRIATNVRCHWIIYRVDTQKQIAQSGPRFQEFQEAIGYIGPKKDRVVMIQILESNGAIFVENPHEIMIGLSCEEKDFKYKILPLERNPQLMTK